MSRLIHYCACGEEIFDEMTMCRTCEGKAHSSAPPCSPAPGDTYKFYRNWKRFEVVTVQQNLGPMCEVRWDNGLFGCVDTAKLTEENKLANKYSP